MGRLSLATSTLVTSMRRVLFSTVSFTVKDAFTPSPAAVME
ncbi:hypothetical protein EVA_08676 [gut metagenome]|uniref:Uncharacterized protein n=1 Tax=gut metagenome TaxID=749906 RepID=J9G8N2_9ZZZZ